MLFGRKVKPHDMLDSVIRENVALRGRLAKAEQLNNELLATNAELWHKEDEREELAKRITSLEMLAGDLSIETKLTLATNYEFGLWILLQQMRDQLVYASGGNASKTTTIQFKSVEEMCRSQIPIIETMLSSAYDGDSKDDERKEEKHE